MRSIFGVDPGLHVGLLQYDFEADRSELHVAEPLEAARWLRRKIRPGDIISCERFIQGRTAKTNQNDALEVTGMCRLVAADAGAIFMITGAGDATKIAPTEVLRALGWWRRGDPDHVRRAAAQAAYVWLRTDPDGFERRTGPGIVV